MGFFSYGCASFEQVRLFLVVVAFGKVGVNFHLKALRKELPDMPLLEVKSGVVFSYQ